MSQVDIGELSVRFEADISKLDKSLADAEKKLGGTEKKMDATAAAATKMAKQIIAALAIDRAARAFVNAMQEAFTAMVDLNREAQRLGVSVEEMSRLDFAARSVGVSFDTLAAATGKLAVAGLKVNETTIALKNLGVSLKDSAGNMRDAPAILGDLAERFAQMPDGIAKSALAVQLFGEAGNKLLPFLNLGRVGLDKLKAEADRLGITLSGTTSKQVEEARATFDRLNASIDTMWRNILADALPALMKIAGVVESFNALGLQDMLRGLIMGLSAEDMKRLVQAERDLAKMGWTAEEVAVAVGFFLETIKAQAGATAEAKAAQDQWTVSVNKSTEAMNIGNLTLERHNELKAMGKTLTEKLMSPTELLTKKQLDYNEAQRLGLITAQTYFSALRNLAIEQTEAQNALAESLGVVFTAQEKQMQQEARIQQARAEGRISSDQYARAMEEMGIGGQKNMQALASSVSSTLTTVFAKSKNAAMAAAVINTAQSITKTFAEYGATPMGIAMAALAAASGAAQIAAIRKSNIGGGGGGAPVAAAGGGAVSAATGGDTGGSSGADRTLFVQGINPGDFLKGDAVRDIAQAIIDFQRDGGRVVLAPR